MSKAYRELPLRIAAGFIMARRKGGTLRYLALANARNGEWGLPKGHRDDGESEMETALRETAEETGIADPDVRPRFRATLDYEISRRGKPWHKRVVHFAAYAPSSKVVLSHEHSEFAWLDLSDMLDRMPWKGLQKVVYRAALFLKDPALFALDPATEAEAYAHLKSLPGANEILRRHLRGGAKLARRFAEALSEAGERVNVEATAAGTVLHDVGRALGDHADHQRAGVQHLRRTALAPYSFACISHFTKGARPKALKAAGLRKRVLRSFRAMTDMRTFTWEEQCAALADACMRQDEPVPPHKRFSDLRRRYSADALIDLQEKRTDKIRRGMKKAIGADPLSLVGLA